MKSSGVSLDKQVQRARDVALACNSILYFTVQKNIKENFPELLNCTSSNALLPKLQKGKANVSVHSSISEWVKGKLRQLQIKCYLDLIEMYFLKNGGSVLDYSLWRKDPPTERLLEYIHSNFPENFDKELKFCIEVLLTGPLIYIPPLLGNEKKFSFTGSSRSQGFPDKHLVITSLISLTPEEISEQIQQETKVYQKISNLQKKGLWNLKLPKTEECKRSKTHWDYLLEEMKSMFIDFANQRYLKKTARKDASRMVRRYFREKKKKAEYILKQEEGHTKRIASMIAKKVNVFWTETEKIIDFKQKIYMNEKQKRLLDTHLNLVVDQAEKISSSLSEDINQKLIEADGSLLKSSSKLKKALSDVSLSKNCKKIKLSEEYLGEYISVPFLLKHQLREYQHAGLAWLIAMFEKNLNGILADEMGLGKTIQTIALLAHLACEKGIWGPHLIIVPTSVMLNWELEFKRWCPSLKILTYYGTPKERKEKRLGWTKQNAFHVCITSYRLAVQDQCSFRRKQWIYFILDEAHYIKNVKSQCWQTLLHFPSNHRLLLTGTPLQNNLSELWSLMHFIMPEIFESRHEFHEWFEKPVAEIIEGHQDYNDNLIKRLHKVLRPFLLRRLKCEVEKQLPNKYEHTVMCKLSKRQRYLYDDFMNQNRTREVLASGNFMSIINILMQLRKVCNHPNLFEPRPIISPFMMESLTYNTASVVWGALDHDPFRHACLSALNLVFTANDLHFSAFGMHRIRKFQLSPSTIEAADTLPKKELPLPAGKIILKICCDAAIRSRISLLAIAGTGFLNSGTVNFDPIRQYNQHQLSSRNRAICNHTSVNGTMENAKKQLLTNGIHTSVQPSCEITEKDTVKESKSKFYIKTLAQRKEEIRKAKLRSLGIINALRCTVHTMYGLDLVEFLSFCMKVQHRETIPEKLHYMCYCDTSVMRCPQRYWHHSKYLSDIVHDTPEEYLNDLAEIIQRFVFVVPSVVAPPIQFHVSHPKPFKLNDTRQYAKELNSRLSSSCASLHSIMNQTTTYFPDPRLIEYDCGKLQTLARLLHKLKSGFHRVLIFTQMTKMLDILEQFLSYHGHTYLRLDSSIKVNMRQALIEYFNVEKKIFCFLLSTRSGGIGVNLTGADTVIFYDSDWNPTMDAQAQDRCHRIGQIRDVHIYRLISERTVEENILQKANQKRLLGNLAIEGGNFTTAFFAKSSLHELFELNDAKSELKADDNCLEEATHSSQESPNGYSEVQLEQALGTAEEESDLKAATAARKEASAMFAEFDENSSVDETLNRIMQQLTPVEKYAVKFLEAQQNPKVLKSLTSA